MKHFDTIEFLSRYSIPYKSTGKNVSEGWVGVRCFFCDDPSYHLGINIKTGSYNCWRCSAKGNYFKLVKGYEKTHGLQSRIKYQDLVHSALSTEDRSLIVVDDNSSVIRCELPANCKNELLKKHRDYLIGRRFDPDLIFTKYKLKCVGITGSKWKFRLIIPIFTNNRLVAFIGRDVTNQSFDPYLNSSREESVTPAHHCVYNIDSVQHTAIIVEGTHDVWRMGDGCVATLGTKFTSAQIRLIASKAKRVFVMYDGEPDAQEQQEKLCWALSTLISEVKEIVLNSGDPCDLSDNEANDIRKDIFGKI